MLGVGSSGYAILIHAIYWPRTYIKICYYLQLYIHIRLRKKTSLHILPTLFNLQWDDQPNRKDDFISFWGAEYKVAYPSISSLYDLFDDNPFPRVPWTGVFLQQGNFSCPKLGRCCCCRISWQLLNVVRSCLCRRFQKSSACFCHILNSFFLGFSSSPALVQMVFQRQLLGVAGSGSAQGTPS